MKRCPRCNRTYTDERQDYCSIDGALLEDERFKQPVAGYAPPPVAWPGEMSPPPPYGWKSNPDILAPVRPVAPPVNYYPSPAWSPAPNKDMAVASLIFGALSVLCFPVPFGQIALVLGFIALGRERKDPARYGGKPFAITGLIMGGFVTLLMLVFLFFILLGAMLG